MYFRTLTIITLSLAGLALSTPAYAQEPAHQAADAVPVISEPADFNRQIYFKNKLEVGFDVGYLPYNTKFIFDFMEGQNWDRPTEFPDYTLIPLDTLSQVAS